VLHDYTHATPTEVAAETDAALAVAERLVSQTVASADAPNFAATLAPLEYAGAAVGAGYGRAGFLGHVHPEASVRDAGSAAEERITKWRVALAFREDVYRAVRAYADTAEAAALTGERRRLLEHWLRDFRRAGHDLEPAGRRELEGLRSRLVELEVAFQRNVNEYQDGIEVTPEQLAGLPDTFVERLSTGKAPGTLRVSLDYPELYPFLEQAQDRSLRKALFEKHWNRAVDDNRPLLAEALEVRRRIATLLGHPTWAHHAMEVKMAETPERVRAFLDELLPPIAEATERELLTLAERLARDGHTGPVTSWDWRYYDEQLRRDEYGVDQERVSEHLPLDGVMQGMFDITGEVFGLTYRHVPPAEAAAWHPSVQLYEIRDRVSGELLAHFYADLFPRDGKFGHAAAFPLVIGHRAADGSYVGPVSAIVANFTPPSGERPALLRHNEVKTLFHEFGHILHMSLTRAEYARFSGGDTEWDFVEAPSQIMEHWTWEPSVLRRFAHHFRTDEPIQPELLEQLTSARWVNVGLKAAVQAFYGGLDLALHAEPVAPDMEAALRASYAVTGMPYPEGTFMLAGFGHLMGGYDAGYYGYLWAEVIGDDMFGRFAREGLLSPAVGADYRREILEPNGSRPADDLVRAFLGREPTNEEYLRLRGMR
jgi:thimet oligopeptidase